MFFKILKTIATSGFLAALECTIFVFGRGSAPDPAGGAYSAPPDPLAGLRRTYPLGGREGKGGYRRVGKGEGGDEGKGKGGGKGKRRKGLTPPPLQIPGSAPALTHKPHPFNQLLARNLTVLLFHTRYFRTCIFQPCSLVLEFSVLVISSTCNFSAPILSI